jgi:hypothetical protein
MAVLAEYRSLRKLRLSVAVKSTGTQYGSQLGDNIVLNQEKALGATRQLLVQCSQLQMLDVVFWAPFEDVLNTYHADRIAPVAEGELGFKITLESEMGRLGIKNEICPCR